jgi:ATP-dependent DNA helicase RecQ
MTAPRFSASAFYEALARWPDSRELLELDQATDSILERLRQCLLDLWNHRASATPLDVVLLLRHWVLAQTQGGKAAWTRVPLGGAWPSAVVWRSQDFEVAEMGATADVRPRAPRLEWLGEQHDLFHDVFGGVQARVPTPIPADAPVSSLLGFSAYTGPGQREAIRALLHLPPGVTLIANLPTGSGKSLLAQLPPMLSPQGSLTLVIVPTVALAIDQGRRMSAIFKEHDPLWSDRPLSFHSGLTLEERTSTFQALRSGQQKVLFTSPEAATGSLRSLLLDCAREGRLSHVVIDEAHLVVTWGSGFRPAFQLLPALISSLRSARGRETQQQLRVALASATLTAHTVTTLKALFAGEAGDCVISGIFLRPEPRYAMKKMASEAERKRCVLEAVVKAPRPFILYVTRPNEAESWLDILRTNGLGRVATFTGKTPPVQRQSLLTAWNNNGLDGMVATSAFGLGVDKEDVRTVIHATLPESLDRFYQEVGRSGRDGRASSSLLLYTDEDVVQARDMSGPTLIGNDLGFERWTAMLDDTTLTGGADGQIWVDLNRLRPGLRIQGTGNLVWNLRTLNLMAIAGLIELSSLSANHPSSTASTDDTEYNDTDVAFASLRLLNPNHRVRAVFEDRMDAARNALLKASAKGFDLMYRTANADLEISDALVNLYGLALPGHWGDVTRFCGGCRVHWGERRMLIRDLRPAVGRTPRFSDRAHLWPPLLELPRQSNRLIFITAPDLTHIAFQDRGCLSMILQACHPHTLLLPRATPQPLVETIRKRLRDTRLDTFVDFFDPTDTNSFQAGEGEFRFIVWLDAAMSEKARASLSNSTSAMTVVFIDAALPDPSRPDRLFISVIAHTDASAVMRRLTQ